MIYNLSQKTTALTYLETLLEKGKRVRVEAVSEKRSLDQNALYWLWITCISRETGNDKDDLHDEFRERFLNIKKIKIFGKEKDKIISTTELNTLEFKNYLDKIQIFSASELGIELPNPEDLKFEQFKEYYKNYL